MTPKQKDIYKTVADASKDFSIVDSLSSSLDLGIDTSLEFESVNSTVTSVAVSALMRDEIPSNGTSTPQCPCIETVTATAHKKKLQMSASKAKEQLIIMEIMTLVP